VNLGALLADRSRRNPDRVALAFDGRRLTYAELNGLAAAAAGGLRELGVGSGQAVAMVLANTPPAIAAYHGALRLGAVAVPLNPLLSAAEIERRVTESGARLVDPETLAGPPVAGLAERAPTDVAVILYTSGTTGQPKRVEVTHAGLRLAAEYIALTGLELHADDVLFGSAPLAHVFGMSGCMNGAIAAGACLALLPRFEAASALDLIESEGVSVFMGVPAMCTALLAASDEIGRAPRMRLAHIGGAPLAAETRRAFERRFGATVLEGYGMTEAGGALTLEHVGQPRSPGSVGTPAAGGELRLAADGEILFRGPTLARGHDGWLATGDIGRIDADGRLFLLDRKKDVILRGGYTVHPREVEEALYTHPGVREAVVIGVPHARLGEEVVALVVTDGSVTDPELLKAHARAQVAAYKYPRLVVIVDQLPHGPTGKVERRAIDRGRLAELVASPA
jgi:long-chain acyl-CoA synthetase